MTRYIPVIYDFDEPDAKMHPEPDGDYIKFEDCQTALKVQEEEIAQLREALERIKRITQVHSSYLALDVCTLAQAALAKEATRD